MKRVLFWCVLAAALAVTAAAQALDLTSSRYLKAASLGDAGKVALLLDEGADLNAQDEEGLTSLMLAAIHNQPAVTELLLKRGVNVFLRDHDGNTALDHAAFLGRVAIARLLVTDSFVDTQDSLGRTPLMEAAQGGHTQIIRLLLGFGAGVNEADKDRDTALHYVSASDSATLLIHSGAALNAKNFNGATPLSTAVFMGRVDTAKALLEAGADPNLGDQGGERPLHKACRQGREVLVSLLLSHKADPDLQDEFGETPLDEAAWKGSAEAVRALLAAGADTRLATPDGRSPLHTAAALDHLAVVRLLAAQAKALNRRDAAGNTAAAIAAYSGSVVLLTVLLEAGADPNLADETGLTPLHKAAWRGSLPHIQVLLNGKALPSPVDRSGRSPLGIALRQGHIEAAKGLRQAGAQTLPGELDTAVFEAVLTNHRAQIIALNAFGANLEALTHSLPLSAGATLSPSADNLTLSPLHTAILTGGQDAARTLLNLGASVQTATAGLRACPGCSALHLAAWTGDATLIGALMEKGASPRATDALGRTPYAVAEEKGHNAVLGLLRNL